MGQPDYEGLVSAIGGLAEFCREIGAGEEAAEFCKLHAKLLADKRSSKQIEERAFKNRGFTAYRLSRLVAKPSFDPAKKERLYGEFANLKEALDLALFPRKPLRYPKADIQGLAGNDEFTTVCGNPGEAPAIAKAAMETVHLFSDAVFGQDIETAYNLCANELREWLSPKRFVSELAKADRQYGGKPVRCMIERITYIEADASTRELIGNSDRHWPKNTPRLNKRAIVGAFWFTHSEENRGRWIMFWVTKEPAGYRIAKWQQYLQ
jgi:hypothetical protein